MTPVDGGRRQFDVPAIAHRDKPRERLDGRARVLTALVRLGPLSRADLAREAVLAPSTVTGVVTGLRREGLVVESTRGAGSHGPGRPPTLLALDRLAGVVVGLDFGKQHATAALADLGHQLLAERRIPLEMDAPAADQLDRAHALVGELLEEAGLDRTRVIGIAAGIPGPIRRETGQLGESTILPGWVGVVATEALEETFGMPVHVENDANLGALAEWMWGVGRDAAHLVYVKISTGIGGGLVLAGQPFAGQSGIAGEIGHLVIEPDGPACRCGNYGCLEAVTGSAQVLDRVRGAHPEVATVAEVVALARAGDVPAINALAHCARAVGAALGGVCTVLNPGVVVIGGELAAAGDLLVAPLAEALGAATLGSVRRDAHVRVGSLGSRAEVLGAVALALRHADAAALLTRD